MSANILHSVGSLLSLWEKSRAATDGLSAMVRAAPRAFASRLFILLAEDREVDVSFRMRLEVDNRSSTIVIEVGSNQAGIICDKVLDVEDILPQQTAVSPVKNSLVKCFINANNKNISLLDPDILVRTNR